MDIPDFRFPQLQFHEFVYDVLVLSSLIYCHLNMSNIIITYGVAKLFYSEGVTLLTCITLVSNIIHLYLRKQIH